MHLMPFQVFPISFISFSIARRLFPSQSSVVMEMYRAFKARKFYEFENRRMQIEYSAIIVNLFFTLCKKG